MGCFNRLFIRGNYSIQVPYNSFCFFNVFKIYYEEWLSKIKWADWNSGDIKNTFPDADLLGRGFFRVIFDIAGTRFRMICI
ncbi:MAG: type II toxin-antitoxin system HigB family toxin [Chitinophagaceae bacterium]